ncbi:MAG: hypothetical protein ABTS22_04640 [Accumulibacter sp.]|uniref:hypothetical protein n=1 Tax=Accumulibacter sp. TaxID=2053492 RepID=UPI003315E049
MHVSAETRLFWHEEPPRGFKEWFLGTGSHGTAVGGGSIRVDEYLSDPTQPELGLKVRGSATGVEVKGLIAVIQDDLRVSPFAGPIELWAKWTSEVLQLDSVPTISTEKQRWLRTFDTTVITPVDIPLDSDEQPLRGTVLPVRGCNVELVKVRLLPTEETWWTYALEAFGTLETVENSLRTVAKILIARHEPALGNPLVASYPAWLSACGQAHGWVQQRGGVQ